MTDPTLAEYERRLATALDECITVWNRAHKENRHVFLEEVAGIGDIIRGVLSRVPWVDVDTTGVQGPPYLAANSIHEDDIRVETFRDKDQPGHQNPRGVKIIHMPTGIIVESGDRRSPLENKAAALEVLRLRLAERENMETRTHNNTES